MLQIRFDAFLLHWQIVQLILSKKRLSTISVCVFKTDKELYLFWLIVDLRQVLILPYIKNERPGATDVAPHVSTIRMMVRIFFIIGRFSPSTS